MSSLKTSSLYSYGITPTYLGILQENSTLAVTGDPAMLHLNINPEGHTE